MIVYLESPVMKVATWLMMFMRMGGKKVTIKMPKNCLDRTIVTLKLHSPDSVSYFLLNFQSLIKYSPEKIPLLPEKFDGSKSVI